MSGTIFLYDETETLVRVREYRAASERKKVIAEWQLKIGEGFLDMAIHIAPDVGDHMVNRNGTNATKSFHPQKKDPPPIRIKRPPSLYDNKNWDF